MLNYTDYFLEEKIISESSKNSYWGRRGVGCILIAKDTGRMLFLKRSNKCRQPRTWGIPGGKIDVGESVDEACRREVIEETGFSIDKLYYLYTFIDNDFEYYTYIHILPFETHPQLNWESSNSTWVDYGEFPSPLHFGVKNMLNNVGDKLKKIIDTIKTNGSHVFSEDVAHAEIYNVNNISKSFIDYIKTVENSTKTGFKNGKFYPYKSLEGGADTIGYGHKLKPGENFSHGISEMDADKLLKHDIEDALKNIHDVHNKWVQKKLHDIKQFISQNPNDPKAKFYNNITADSPIFKLDQTQQEMLLDFMFNLGSLKKFPKFTEAVFGKQWDIVKKEYKRSYKDAKGNRHELIGRNAAFYNMFLKNIK